MRSRIAGGILVVIGCGTLLFLGRDLLPHRDGGSRGEIPSRHAAEPQAQGSGEAGHSAARLLPPSQEELWSRPAPEEAFASFAAWTRRYAAAATPETRAALEADGVRLARVRLPAMAEQIQSNPERALELAVPRLVREKLPAAVQALIEQPVNARGDLEVLAFQPEPGNEKTIVPVLRYAEIDGERHQVFTYGGGLAFITKSGVPLNGIRVPIEAAARPPAANGLAPAPFLLALSDSPARVLDAAEVAYLKQAQRQAQEPVCSISGKPWTVNNEETALQFAGNVRLFCGRGHAADWAAAAVAASGLEGPFFEPASAPIVTYDSYTTGRKRFLILRPGFSDFTNTMTDAEVPGHFNAFSNQMYEMSFGKLVFAGLGQGSDATPIMRLPGNAVDYDNTGLGKLYDTSKAVAQTNYGFNLAQYDFLYVVTGARPAATYAGLGFVRGVGFHLANGYYMSGTASHEFGHNLGLNHANFWSTAGKTIIGAGTSVEYGDGNDPMGGAGSSPQHYGSRYKNYLTWIPDTDVATVTATNSGTYRLYSFDQADVPGGYRGLKITRNSSQNYWVNFRQRFTSKAMLNGVELLWTGNANQNSLLLDTRLKDASGDNALAIGRTFSDTSLGLHITPVGKGHTYPESMDVVINVGAFPANQPPTCVVRADATSAVAGQTLTFNATATDPNGDTLAYYWEFGDADYSVDNSPTHTHSFAGAGEFVVQCTVSDMKGGTARDSVLVRVGSPAAFRISGRVLRLDQRPLAGIKVSADATHAALSDSDGTYAITGLGAGSYTVDAVEPVSGAPTFIHPFFLNPVIVGPSAGNMDFIQDPGSQAQAGVVYLSSPESSAVFTSPTSLTLNAVALATSGSFTNVQFYDGATKLGEDTSAPFSLAWNSVPAGAHSLTIRARSTTGISVTSAPVNISVVLPPSPAVAMSLIQTGAVWKYLAIAGDAPTTWTRPEFDDSTWPAGHAEFGYGEGDEATAVPYGGNTANKWITSYYRTAFTINDPGAVTNLALRLKRDDGAIVYLNGIEILRDNMPPGPATWSTLAMGAPDDGQVFLSFTLNPATLTPGTNVMAVEVHQSAASTSDLSFDLGLDALAATNRPRGVYLAAPADGTTIAQPTNITLAAQVVAGGTLGVASVDFFDAGVKIGAANNSPFALTWTSKPAGLHQLVAVATDSSGSVFTSAPVNITVTSPPAGIAFVSFGDVWNYLDDGSDPGASWTGRTYDDRAWSAGPARLGYGGDGELTTVSYGADADNKQITTYFRRAFTVANPATFSGLLLRLIRDDGAVVYLNGAEILRDNLLPGLVSWNSLAVATISPPGETTPIEASLTTAGLLPGTNVLAVEVHQAAVNSSDLGFDMALIGLVSTNTAQGIYLTSPANGDHYNSPAAVGLSAFAAAPDPVSLVEYFDGASKIGQSAARSYPFTWNSPPVGAHSLTARAVYGAGLLLTSPPVKIVVGYPPAPVAPIFDTLIQAGSTWSYWDSVTPVAAGWQGNGFNDATWPVARARFGYGLDGEATLLTQGRTTVYFRRWITVANPFVLSELIFRLQRDDGAVVYLNGAEVYRSNMPAGAVTAGTPASTTVNTPEETLFFETVVPAATLNLVTGSNLVAVELHQAGATSSDAGFDLQLIASGATEPRVYFSAPIDGSSYTVNSTIVFEGNAFAGAGLFVSKVELLADGIKLGETSVLPFHFAWAMPGPGPHTVVARMIDSRGVPVDSSPLFLGVVRQTFTRSLIASNSGWKYLDNGSNQGTNWTQLNFNDAAWASGPARLGYGGDGEATTVSFGSDPNAKYITTYFRKSFVVPPGAVYTNLLFKLARDDGAVIHLNGREAYRDNMKAGTITYTNFSAAPAADEQTFFPTNIAVTNLPPGTNVVAVEIHQSNLSSSDIGFNLELTGSGYLDDTSIPAVSVALAGGMIEISWPSTYTSWRVYTSSDAWMPMNQWTPVAATPAFVGGRIVVILPPSGETQFFRLGRP